MRWPGPVFALSAASQKKVGVVPNAVVDWNGQMIMQLQKMTISRRVSLFK